MLLCLLGLCYQTYLIAHEYLKYAVSTSVSLNQMSKYLVPSQSVCFKIHEIFDYDTYNSESKSDITFDLTNAETVYVTGTDSLKILTISDIWHFTPPASSIASSCDIRNGSKFAYHAYKGAECYKMFEIEKYIIATLVCYKLTLKQSIMKTNGENSNTYSKESTYFTPSDNGNIYFFFFNQSAFPRFDLITNVMHPIDNYPFQEFPLTQIGSRRYNYQTGESILNLFGCKSNTVTVRKMPPPYETMCQNYQHRNTGKKTMDEKFYRFRNKKKDSKNIAGEVYRDSQHCLLSCITEGTQSQFKKASLANHYFKGADLHMLTNDDFHNETISEIYGKILLKCNSACPENDCNYVSTYTTTIGTSYVYSGVLVELPDRPSFIIAYGKKVTFLDTFNFICGCVGVWFGFSFADLNPYRKRTRPSYSGKKSGRTCTHAQSRDRSCNAEIAENRRLITMLFDERAETNRKMQSIEIELMQLRMK